MRDIREKIIAILEQKPGDTFSISQIARAIGASNKSTNAALGRLLKRGIVERRQKGLYSVKKAWPQEIVTPIEQLARPAEIIPSLSVISIDVLVEGEKSKIDSKHLLRKLLEDEAVLDARVRNIVEADRSKLKIKLTLPDE